MDSEGKDEPFFSQLKKLATAVDKQLSVLQGTQRHPEFCQAHIIKTVSNLKKDVKSLKVGMNCYFGDNS